MTMAASMLTGAANPFSAFCCCSQRRTGFLFSSPPTTLRSPVHRLIPPQLMTNSLSLSAWSGLKFLGFPSRRNFIRRERRGKCRGKVVYASLFGVGAPEALVIGVVALLIFGPKGLAEVARNLGKTLRAFQPTIRELQEVSREFKSTLEREIGLDEVASSTNNTYKPPIVANDSQQAQIDPNGTPKAGAYTSEDLLKITEEQLATTSATKTQSQTSTPPAQPQDTPANNPSEATTAAAASEATAFIAPEAAIQIPSPSEKTEKER